MSSHSSPSGNSDEDPFAFRAALREQLVQSANKKFARQRMTHRGLIAAVWVMLIGIIGTVALVATDSRDASASTIRVTESASYRTVSLVDINADPQQVTKDLQAEGIKASIGTVPVGPTAVGHFIGTGSNEAADIEFLPDADGGSTSFRIKNSQSAILTFDIGRAAKPNEDWAAGIDAFLNGYLLHCSRLWHASPDEVKAYAAARGFDVQFTSPTEPNLVTGENMTGVLTEANQYADKKVNVLLTSDGVDPYAGLKPSTGATDCQ